MVMEPTDFRYRDHSAPVSSEDRARFRTIHRQRQMRPPLVIIGQGAGQETCDMALVQDHDMVQALPANTPDQPLDIRILPHPWGCCRWGTNRLMANRIGEMSMQISEATATMTQA
jgi:hypothetical protein